MNEPPDVVAANPDQATSAGTVVAEVASVLELAAHPQADVPCGEARRVAGAFCRDPRASRRARQQRSMRQQEQAQRAAVARCVEQARDTGLSLRRAAAALERSERTLRRWRTLPEGVPALRGRQVTRYDVATRNRVVHFLHHITGPAVGLPALRALFPSVRRCLLADLLKRYRRVWRMRYCPFGLRLTWHRAGSVWAMDFSQAPYPVDGVSAYIFAVRDLASGYQLLWQRVPSEKAEAVIPLLNGLFREQGRPLVLKSDNGSAFVADLTVESLAEQCVVPLFSPAGRPSYNGGLERSNSVNKLYTGQHAIGAGHPFQWHSEDLEAARKLTNAISRPWGERGPTPEQAWLTRTPPTDDERHEFVEKLTVERPIAAAELGLDLGGDLDHRDRSRLDRHALAAVLEELGYLSYRRGKRICRRPRRPTKEAMARRAERHLESVETHSQHKPQTGSPAGCTFDKANDTLAGIAASLPPLLNHPPCVTGARSGAPAFERPADSEPTPTPPQPPPPPPPAPATRNPIAVPDPLPAPACSVAMAPPRQATLAGHNVRARESRAANNDGDEARAQMLAGPHHDATMHKSSGAADVATRPAILSARGERAITSWLRSPLHLLVSILKAAKIMR